MHDQVRQIDMFSSYCFLSLSCLESYVFGNVLRETSPIIRQGVCVCGIYVFAEDGNILRSFLIR